jgi:hypothetical protein
MEELTKEDIEQLEKELKELKELYQKELEREVVERNEQATRDSDQAKILEQKELEEQKSQAEEKTAEIEYKKAVLAGFDALLEKDSGSETLTELNTNISKLIEYEQFGAQKQTNQEFVGTAILTVLLFGFGIYGLIKACSWIVSKINNAIFY